MWGMIQGLLGLGGKVLDRVIPDRTRAADQAHERSSGQAAATLEGERQKNYFTPRAIILYAMAFAVIYGVVLRPFATAFGLDLPAVDIAPAMRILLGLLGLEFGA